jgi:hypothetical protein
MTVPSNPDRLDVMDFLLAGLYELCARPWIQGATNRESDGAVCAMGALFAAQNRARASGCAARGSAVVEAAERLEAAATMLAGEPMTVPLYNDAEGRTKGDIIRLFERAIEAVDATEEQGASDANS